MVLYISNKILSLRGNSEVLDEQGNKMYKITGRFLSIRNAKFVYNKDGKLVYIIKNKFWKFLQDSVLIKYPNRKTAGLLKPKKLISRSFVLKGYPEEITLDADGFALNINANQKLVGRIRNKFTIVTDKFELEMFDENYTDLCVALVIGIDNFRDMK